MALKTALTKSQATLYGRQTILPQLGATGQLNICESTILVVGAGGLGSSALLYLAANGVGNIILFDPDIVEESNLHRQIIHTRCWVGRPKVESARHRCNLLNPSCIIVPFQQAFDPQAADAYVSGCSLLVDCSDNLPTRLLVSDAGRKYGKPVVTGSALRFQGQILIFSGQDMGCYRCLLKEQSRLMPDWDTWDNDEFEKANNLSSKLAIFDKFLRTFSGEAPQDCSSDGVFGPVPGLIGIEMAIHALRTISHMPGNEAGPGSNFYTYDALNTKAPHRALKLNCRRPCVVCESDIVVWRPQDYARLCPGAMHPPCDEISWGQIAFNGDEALIDVRPQSQTDALNLPTASKIPLDELLFLVRRAVSDMLGLSDCLFEHTEIAKRIPQISASKPIFVVCRRGNASRTGTWMLRKLIECLSLTSAKVFPLSVKGGVIALTEPLLEAAVAARRSPACG